MIFHSQITLYEKVYVLPIDTMFVIQGLRYTWFITTCQIFICVFLKTKKMDISHLCSKPYIYTIMCACVCSYLFNFKYTFDMKMLINQLQCWFMYILILNFAIDWFVNTGCRYFLTLLYLSLQSERPRSFTETTEDVPIALVCSR